MNHEHIISKVEPGSIAGEMEIEAGDKLLSINGRQVLDVFDYHFYAADEELVLLIEKKNHEQWQLEIEKEAEEDLGLVFEESLMDSYRSCKNNCMFCFIDQMPKGMRDTLYFKDDDSRLSFLQGNYITLTNMSEQDVKRIVKYHLEPINISFHTTNPKLRCTMLHNRFAGEALKKVDILYNGQIEMNGQIVLCKAVNDKDELERSIRDLTAYLPYLRSVSVVPVGLTKYRDGLHPLEPFTKEDAKEVLEVIHRWQKQIFDEFGLHFVHGADEWYLLAEEEVPEEDRYDGYLQLENGVGMLRLLQDEFQEALQGVSGDQRERNVTIATGKLAAPCLEKLMKMLNKKYPNIKSKVFAVKNHFFGQHITVSGLLTGMDIVEQLKGKIQGETLLLPCNLLRAGEDVFLDDFTVKDVEKSLQVHVDIVKSSGLDLLEAVLK